MVGIHDVQSIDPAELDRSIVAILGGKPLPPMTAHTAMDRYRAAIARIKEIDPSNPIQNHFPAGYLQPVEMQRVEGILLRLLQAEAQRRAAIPMSEARAPLSILYTRYCKAAAGIEALQIRMVQHRPWLKLLGIGAADYTQPIIERDPATGLNTVDELKGAAKAFAPKVDAMESRFTSLEDVTHLFFSAEDRQQSDFDRLINDPLASRALPVAALKALRADIMREIKADRAKTLIVLEHLAAAHAGKANAKAS